MTAAEQPAPSSADGRSPASFLAAAAALHAIDDALHAARRETSDAPDAGPGTEQALASCCCCGRSASSSPDGRPA